MTDEQQFEAFMLAYQDMVFSTAVRLLGREAEAEDVAQEVFLKAFEHYDEIRDSPTAGGWLKTVTRNLCLNHLTRYRARWRFFTDLSDEDSDTGFLDRVPAPDHREEEMTAAGQRQVLEAALQKLPPTQRIPLVLYHFEDLSYEDIAARLKISLAKVKTDIHRGREALRKKLQLSSVGAEELESWVSPAAAGICGQVTPTP
jgi:RNA polymerase sigma-70 factor (ECF subfamily)